MNKNRQKIRKKRKILNAIALFFVIVASLLAFSARWMFYTWNKLTMDELVYHLNAPLDGTNDDMIKQYITSCVVPTIVVLVAGIIFVSLIRQRNRQYLGGLILLCGSFVLIGITWTYTWLRLDISTYIADQRTDSTFIEENYVFPDDVEISFPTQKRNLIYIFLESMEITYANQSSGGAFEENVIPELTELAQNNEDFSGSSQELNGAHALNGTTFTMGAMFAHTSGLPLNVSINGNDMDTQDSFFPEITTLGDILEEQGYNQELLVGSNAKFGGRKLYFTDHGNYTIHDYNYAKKEGLIDKDYKVWWGYEDEKLFEYAKNDLTNLAQQEEPFNLTMLTVDTHFENGYVCDLCGDEFDDQYANVMACSSKQISDFISWIQEQDFYENTTIILAGDHLTMDSDFLQSIDADYDERVYTAFINAPVTPENDENRNYSTFDLFPTTLAALGVEIEGNRLALGTNLFSKEQTLTEEYGLDVVNREIKKNSEFLNELEKIEETESLEARQKYRDETFKFNLKVSNITEDNTVTVTAYNFMGNAEASRVKLSVWGDDTEKETYDMIVSGEEYNIDVNVTDVLNDDKEYYIQATVITTSGEEVEGKKYKMNLR